MNNTIDWTIFEEQLGNRVADCQYLLNKALAEHEVRKEILKHKSQSAYKAFKQFLREVDKAPIADDQKIDTIKQFKVADHL
jgi:hypothetical protein